MVPSEQYLLIVGAPKSATTTLATWLSEHKDVALAKIKEPRFFTDFGRINWRGPGAASFRQTLIQDEESYRNLFAENERAHWRLDASTDYLWCEASPNLIADWAARYRVKIVCIVRDPVERVISEYQHTIRDGLQKCPLQRSLEMEPERYLNNWHPLFYHIRRSCYARPVHRYADLFEKDFLVLNYEDFRNPDQLLAQLADFVGLSAWEPKNTSRNNESYVYRGPFSRFLGTNSLFKEKLKLLIPKRARGTVRSAFTQIATKEYRITREEVSFLRENLKAEIAACRRSPLIPTDNWSLGESQLSQSSLGE